MKKPILFVFLCCMMSSAFVFGSDQSAAVTETLKKYAAAVQSKSVAEVEKYVVTTDAFTIFEGSHTNLGWADYRDNHLGPELKEFNSIQYQYRDIKSHAENGIGFATFKYHIAVSMESRDIEVDGLGTAILVNTGQGWKIQHMHTSQVTRKDNGQ